MHIETESFLKWTGENPAMMILHWIQSHRETGRSLGFIAAFTGGETQKALPRTFKASAVSSLDPGYGGLRIPPEKFRWKNW